MTIQISINLNIFPTQETKMNQLVLLTNQTPGVVTFENYEEVKVALQVYIKETFTDMDYEKEGPSFGFSTIILSEFILPQTSQVSINTGFFYCLKT